MSIASIVAQLQTLIDASNETTGKTDTDLTTAVERLIRGWGGSTMQVTEKDITLESENEYLSFECDHEPDIVAIYAKNWTTGTEANGVVGLVVYKGFALGWKRYDSGTYKYSNTTEIDETNYPYGNAGGNGTAGGSYSNGTFTMRARGGSGNKWSTKTYHATAITF